MLLQAVLLAFVLVFLWLVVIVERNIRMAPLYAQHWAPQIRSVLASPGTVLAPGPTGPYAMQRSAVRPAHLWFRIDGVAAAGSVNAELAQLGLHVRETYLDLSAGDVMLWALIADGDGDPDAPPQWVGGHGLEAMPALPARLPVELLLLVAVNTLLSLYFARRITSPIELLRRHMHNTAHDKAHNTAHDKAQPGLAQGLLPPPALPPDAPLELREMHADYSRLIEQLQRQERERLTLLAGVSHDLRSPLGRIRLAAELLPEVPDNRDGVASITRNVDHADRLVGSFLDCVRAGALPLDEVVDLGAALGLAVARFDKPADQLCLHLPPQPLRLRANTLLIDRLAFNLIDNAFKHGLAPVAVALAPSNHPPGVVLTVTDQGAGLAAVGGAVLFEAFSRGDSSRQVPGFGLGLAVVQQIVDRLQGSLQWQRDDSGHTVRITLPQHGD